MAVFGRAIPWKVKRNESRASRGSRGCSRRGRHRGLFGGRQQSAGAAAACPVAAAPPLETVEVLVAKSDLSRGQVIEQVRISVGRLGRRLRPTRASSKSPISRMPPRSSILSAPSSASRCWRSGDPIRDPNVVMAKGSGFMAAILPEGHARDGESTFRRSPAPAAFILPEDRVDVVLTRRDKAAEKSTGVEKFVSDTIFARRASACGGPEHRYAKGGANGTKSRCNQDRDAGVNA